MLNTRHKKLFLFYFYPPSIIRYVTTWCVWIEQPCSWQVAVHRDKCLYPAGRVRAFAHVNQIGKLLLLFSVLISTLISISTLSSHFARGNVAIISNADFFFNVILFALISLPWHCFCLVVILQRPLSECDCSLCCLVLLCNGGVPTLISWMYEWVLSDGKTMNLFFWSC